MEGDWVEEREDWYGMVWYWFDLSLISTLTYKTSPLEIPTDVEKTKLDVWCGNKH